MTKTTHGSEYFCGNKISNYGREHGYLDYSTLAKAFDAVLVNDITKLFYNTLGNEYIEPEQINGYIDNSEQIDELNEKAEELFDKQAELDENTPEWDEIENKITEIKEQIDELENEQDKQQEIYQYFIVSYAGADIIEEYTNDPLFYIEKLDMYIWGVTHWGTNWEYVLTDVKIKMEQ